LHISGAVFLATLGIGIVLPGLSNGRSKSIGGCSASHGSIQRCQSARFTISGILSWCVVSSTSSFGSTVMMAKVSISRFLPGERQRRHTPTELQADFLELIKEAREV
jgi:hypothetical protein